MRYAVGLRHNEIEGLSDRLLSAVSEERLGPVVPQADHPSTIRINDGVGSVRNQCCFQCNGLRASHRPFLFDLTI